MRNTLRYLLIAVVGWLCSCSAWMKGPSAYEDEIRDAVAFHLAEADYIIEQAGNLIVGAFLGGSLFNNVISERFDEMEAEFNDLYVNTDMYYSDVLEAVSQDKNSKFRKDAKKILRHYNHLNIVLSDYEQMSRRNRQKSWTFYELHTGVEFIFTLEKDESDQTTYYISPVESSLQEYIQNSL